MIPLHRRQSAKPFCFGWCCCSCQRLLVVQNKANVIEPFCSCTCCWNRSRFTCLEGSDINWLSFMSLTIATENTYTPAQLEALVQSSQLSSSFLSRLRSYHFQLTRKFSLMKSLFEISTHFSCLVSAMS